MAGLSGPCPFSVPDITCFAEKACRLVLVGTRSQGYPISSSTMLWKKMVDLLFRGNKPPVEAAHLFHANFCTNERMWNVG